MKMKRNTQVFRNSNHEKARKHPQMRMLLAFLAEREGFEPSCACAQTDFESAPL